MLIVVNKRAEMEARSIPEMDTDLTNIKAALADISDTELAALIAGTYGVPQTAPGLLAWIDGACDWELNRRRDFDYPLLPTEAAIDPSEDEVSINFAIVLRPIRPGLTGGAGILQGPGGELDWRRTEAVGDTALSLASRSSRCTFATAFDYPLPGGPWP